jgi:tryptophanyl-tRNA synthetase
MSKSFGNSIFLKDSPEVIRQKIQPMKTDIRRKRRSDPGEPEDCPAFTLHKAFVAEDKRKEIAEGCRTAGIGCLECKNVVIEELIHTLAPFRKKREEFINNPNRVWNLLEMGNTKARTVAEQTMTEVRAALGF